MKISYLSDLDNLTNLIAEKIKTKFANKADIPTDYIVSGSQTTTSGEDGGTNVYTFMTSNGKPSIFEIKNGTRGSKGDPGTTGQRGSRWNSGTAITGTNTSDTIFSGSGITDAFMGDYYLNTSTGYVYKCTVAGDASVAKWVYAGSIKGATGAPGPAGTSESEITEADIDKIINGTYNE